MSPESLQIIFAPIILGLVIFFVGREIVLWYFKVNKIVEELQTMNKYLKSINESLLPEQPAITQPIEPPKVIKGIKLFTP